MSGDEVKGEIKAHLPHKVNLSEVATLRTSECTTPLLEDVGLQLVFENVWNIQVVERGDPEARMTPHGTAWHRIEA
jgi:DNA polymerase III psi subunit